MVLGCAITAIAVLVVTGLLYFKLAFNYWKRKNVYTLPPAIPFGNVKKFVLGQRSFVYDAVELYEVLKAKRLPYGGHYILAMKAFLPADLQLIQNILIKDFQYFTAHTFQINEENDPLMGHLFALSGAKWKALRAKLTPTFSSGKLKMMFQTLIDCTKDLPSLLDDAIEASEPIDIKETFARYTTDVIGSCAFGIECSCIKNQNTEFRKYGKRIFQTRDPATIIKNIFFHAAPRLMLTLKLSLTEKAVENFFMNLVKQTTKFRDENSVKRNDFMQLLLDLRHTTLKMETKSSDNQTDEEYGFYQNGLSLKEITAQAFVFFFAGFETSSTTLTFLMYELATNPEIQEKLREEVYQVSTKYDGNITYESLTEMTYLDKCIHETLRKYPPVGTLLRLCTKTYKVPGSDLTIEKDTFVTIPVFAIHRDPEYYPEPEKFDPERFSEENKQKLHPCAYLPFGEGPRICIGLRFGILQTKVGLIAVLRNYRFRLNPKTKTPLEFAPHSFILTVKGDVWIDAERIDSS